MSAHHAPDTTDTPLWHTLSAEQAQTRLDTPSSGLSEAEVGERLARHGPNRLPEGRTRSVLERIAAQINNLLIYVLIAAAGITALMGHWIDTTVIMAVW
jgi:magnesium-transporting ATPase (P-type)